MEKKELRKIIEELDIKRKVVEMKGDTPDYDTDNRYYYLSEDDILVLLDKAREEGWLKGMRKMHLNYMRDKESVKELESLEQEFVELVSKLSNK